MSSIMADQQPIQAPTTGSNTQETNPSLALGDEWDEERLKGGMETLKDLHIQIRALRATIPRIIAPFATQQPSPEALYQEITEAAKRANVEIKAFRDSMNDQATRDLLEQAKKSRAERPKGIKTWKAKDHPDWLTKTK